jgi:hypothetical protein
MVHRSHKWLVKIIPTHFATFIIHIPRNKLGEELLRIEFSTLVEQMEFNQQEEDLKQQSYISNSYPYSYMIFHSLFHYWIFIFHSYPYSSCFFSNPVILGPSSTGSGQQRLSRPGFAALEGRWDPLWSLGCGGWRQKKNGFSPMDL